MNLDQLLAKVRAARELARSRNAPETLVVQVKRERPDRAQQLSDAIRENYRDCPACQGAVVLPSGQHCAICCGTGIYPRDRM